MQEDTVNKMYTQRVVVAFILLVLFGSMIFESCQSVAASIVIHDLKLELMGSSTSISSQYQNVTYEGELFVSNNETFAIQNSEFYMIGNITVQDTSTLVIRNSNFTAIPTSRHLESIVLEDQAKLIITNATLVSKQPDNFFSRIVVQNDAEASITYSTFQEGWRVQAGNNSIIHVNDSTITSGDIYHGSGIVTYGTSSIIIENSTIDGAYVWKYSTVSIKNSIVGLVRAGDMTDVNIADSEIGAIETWGGLSWEEYSPTFVVQDSTVTWRAEFRSNSSGRFTSSSVAEVVAYGNSNIMLIDSYAGSIETHDESTVFVGWHLPLFGLITMHYTWVSIIQTIVIATIIAIIITVLVFLYRKRARRVQREYEYQAR